MAYSFQKIEYPLSSLVVVCDEDTNNAMTLRALCALRLNSGALDVLGKEQSI